MRPGLRDRNPYFVLGLDPPASAAEVERSKNRLLALMAARGRKTVDYVTPMGPRSATEDDIRKASMILAEPRERLLRGIWAERLGREGPGVPKSETKPLRLLRDALGWWP